MERSKGDAPERDAAFFYRRDKSAQQDSHTMDVT